MVTNDNNNYVFLQVDDSVDAAIDPTNEDCVDEEQDEAPDEDHEEGTNTSDCGREQDTKTENTGVTSRNKSSSVLPPSENEIKQYCYTIQYDGKMTSCKVNPKLSTEEYKIEVYHSIAAEFIHHKRSITVLMTMVMGDPEFEDVLQSSPSADANRSIKKTWTVAKNMMKNEVHRRSHFLMQELEHDSKHPLRNQRHQILMPQCSQ